MLRSFFVGLFLALVAAPALAQENYGVVGCGPASSKNLVPRQLSDGALYLARNEIGPVQQDIASAAVSHSFCDGDRNGRWRFEGNLSLVDDDFDQAQSVVAGVGYQFSLGPTTSFSPVARIGYASFGNADDQVAAGVGLIFSHSAFVSENQGADATWLTFDFAPEYTNWQSTDVAAQALSFDDGVFSNFAAAGVSFPVQNLRGRFRVAHRYIDSEGPVSSIGSVILSLGRDTLGGACNGKCWNVDLWFSKGDGDYSSVLIGLSSPIGR